MKEKTALVLSGGGMKVSYTSGVVQGLAELGVTDFDIVIAGSGATGLAAYYVTHQLEYMDTCWKLIASPRFMSLRRFWKVIDPDYLTKDVFTNAIPLNKGALRASKTELQIPLLNNQTGKIRYFSNHDYDVDIMDVIRASHCIPFLAKPTVIQNVPYSDSFEGSIIWFQIQRAYQLGATKIVVVNCLHKNLRSMYAVEEWLSIFNSHRFKKKHKHYHTMLLNHVLQYDPNNLLYISPALPTGCGDFTNDYTKLMHAFEMGKKDALRSRVKEFLQI